MARYSRRTFPAANFTLLTPPSVIPQSLISRTWDEGELFAIVTTRIRNDAAASKTISLDFRLDDVALHTSKWAHTIPAGGNLIATIATLIPITAGLHTISVEGERDASADQVVLAQLATLTVIQLPLWDAATDIL